MGVDNVLERAEGYASEALGVFVIASGVSPISDSGIFRNLANYFVIAAGLGTYIAGRELVRLAESSEELNKRMMQSLSELEKSLKRDVITP